MENHRNKKIKFLRSNRGGEYLSYEFGLHLKQHGIVSQLVPPGTLERNAVSKRRNRTLLDMVRSMMSLTNLPLSFWGYALETAAFTLNRAPSKSVETTPYELCCLARNQSCNPNILLHVQIIETLFSCYDDFPLHSEIL